MRDYIEKPTLRYQVSMGIYVYEARALRHLPEGPCQFPELVHRLLAEGETVAACETDADWYDIGTVGEYERAAADVERDPEKYHLEPLLVPRRDVFACDAAPAASGRGEQRTLLDGAGRLSARCARAGTVAAASARSTWSSPRSG